VLFVVLVPAITMRAVAEERKSGTLELLLTFPMDDWQITLGKFLASLGMVSVALACTLPYAFTVAALTGPGPSFDWGPVFAGYFGLVLLASAFIGLGLWGSALSKNQIVGFIFGLVLCFAFYFVDKFAPLLPRRARAGRRVPLGRLPLREHLPRRHRHARSHLLPLAHRDRPAHDGTPDPVDAALNGAHS
jgi:hypothetical protein